MAPQHPMNAIKKTMAPAIMRITGGASTLFSKKWLYPPMSANTIVPMIIMVSPDNWNQKLKLEGTMYIIYQFKSNCISYNFYLKQYGDNIIQHIMYYWIRLWIQYTRHDVGFHHIYTSVRFLIPQTLD